MNTDQLSGSMEQIKVIFIDYAPRLAGAILVLIIGFWLVNRICNMINKAILRRGWDISLQTFFADLINIALKVLVLISVAGMIGIQTTSFVAILGAAGLAVGLALQGSLANFAGGVLILAFKPYKVGDLIESNGEFGEVSQIQIFNTILTNPDNKTVFIPNGALAAAKIINYSTLGNIRVNLNFQIETSINPQLVREAIENEVFKAFDLILEIPTPSVNVFSYVNGMTVLTVHVYCDPTHYWSVYYQTTERIRTCFIANNWSIPMPASVQYTKHVE